MSIRGLSIRTASIHSSEIICTSLQAPEPFDSRSWPCLGLHRRAELRSMTIKLRVENLDAQDGRLSVADMLT